MKRQTKITLFWLVLILLVAIVMGRYAVLHQKVIKPVKIVYVAHQADPIKDYILRVFGPDYPKAMRLLSCENKSLNPNAVNINTDGSRDVGVFQISEKWQRIQAKFLYNPYINVLVAHQLYQENGNSFRLWSCGKMLSI